MNVDRHEVLALALGQLPEGDQWRVQRALDRDPHLRLTLRHDLDALSHLLDDLEPLSPSLSAQAEAQLLARIRSEPPSHAPWPPVAPALAPSTPATPTPTSAGSQPGAPFSWLWPAALSLVLALVLAFALRPATDLPSRYAATPGAQVRVLEGEEGKVGRMVRLSDGRVYVHMDRALEPGRTYQLWRLLPPRPGGRTRPRSLGVFESGLMTRAMPRGAVLAVSVEPPGGNDRPSTPLLFKQRVRLP